MKANVEPGLGHTRQTLKDLEDWLADAVSRRTDVPASTKTSLVDREVPLGDGQCFEIAKHLLRDFRPKLITIQMLALDDAHADAGFWDYDTDYEQVPAAHRGHRRAHRQPPRFHPERSVPA